METRQLLCGVGGGLTFPYLGNSYGSVFVGSDGHITLGAAEASSNTRNCRPAHRRATADFAAVRGPRSERYGCRLRAR